MKMVYFHGDYELMVAARDEVLIPLKYSPCYRNGNNFTSQYVRSPDGIFLIQFEGESPVVIALTDITMTNGITYKGEVRPNIEQLVEILDPKKITRFPNHTDVTLSLNIE